MLTEKTNSKLKDDCITFLKEFKENDQYKYRVAIEMMPGSNFTSISISFQDILSQDIDLAIELQKRPHFYLQILSQAIYEVLEISDPEYALIKRRFIKARITDMTDQIEIRAVNSGMVGQLVNFKGIVTKISQAVPLPVISAFRCQDNHLTFIENPEEKETISPPFWCSQDGCRNKFFVEDEEKSVYTDLRSVLVQELPEEMPAGQLPNPIDLKLSYDLANSVLPGNHVQVTGYLQVVEGKHSKSYRMRGVSIEVKERENAPDLITPEEERSFADFAKSPGSYERLISSIAPHIFGNEDEKEGCLLLLIGGPSVEAEGAKLRGNINVLLAGDPGLSKTNLLRFVADVAPRGIYANGKASSSAGLTAAVVREKNNLFSLVAGATVLGDLGVTCIDEMSQMNPEDRSGLHEVMEQNRVSIAKGGFVATLNARTSILGATNPALGKYDPFENILTNLSDFPLPLLDRFDLIFIMRDTPNPEIDGKIADHILAVRSGHRVPQKNLISQTFLKKYIAYAKTRSPELLDEAKALLKQEYLDMRASSGGDNQLPYSPRFLESMIRLSFARARVLLHPRVTVEDAKEAIRLVQISMERALTDTKTKKVDPGMLFGKPLSDRTELELALVTFRDLAGPQKEAVEDKALIDALMKTGRFNEEAAQKVFRAMYRSGQIYETKPHFFKRI